MSILRTLSPALALTAGALLSACSSTSSSVSSQPEMSAYEMATMNGEAYTLIVLRAGLPEAIPTGAELAALTTEHTAFVEEMAEEGFLLTSGPMVAPRAEPSYRGLFFVDSADAASAYDRACGDPATQAGAFTIEAIPFMTTADMRILPAMERSSRLQRGAEHIVARPYVVMMAPSSAALEAIMAQMGDMVLFSGQCTGGSMEDTTLCVMNCRTIDEATTAVRARTREMENFTFQPWVSSASLAEMNDGVLMDVTDEN